jgi:AcrR family transcriptional regulator
MAKGEDRREQIKRKAAQLFLKMGYERTTMRALAKAVGIQEPGLYYYFKNKKAILEEITKDSWKTFQDSILKDLEKVDDPEERIKRYIANMVKFQLKLGEIVFIIDSPIALKYVKERKTHEKVALQVGRKALQDLSERTGLMEVDPLVAAFSLGGMLGRIYKWYDPKGRIDIEDLTEQVTHLFLYGYCGKSQKNKKT